MYQTARLEMDFHPERWGSDRLASEDGMPPPMRVGARLHLRSSTGVMCSESISLPFLRRLNE